MALFGASYRIISNKDTHYMFLASTISDSSWAQRHCEFRESSKNRDTLLAAQHTPHYWYGKEHQASFILENKAVVSHVSYIDHLFFLRIFASSLPDAYLGRSMFESRLSMFTTPPVHSIVGAVLQLVSQGSNVNILDELLAHTYTVHAAAYADESSDICTLLDHQAHPKASG